MKLRTRIMAFILVLCTLVTLVPITAISAFAQGSALQEDAMDEINKDGELALYKQGQTLSNADDGYIGIPYKVTVYYDSAKGAAKPGYMTNGATPVILYVVNADFERIGTDSDVSIIKSMIKRGYAVAVLDYLNDAKAVSPALDYSAQLLRSELASGAFFENKEIFTEGPYQDNIIVRPHFGIILRSHPSGFLSSPHSEPCSIRL